VIKERLKGNPEEVQLEEKKEAGQEDYYVVKISQL